MRRKWSTTTAFPDASQTMPDTRKEHFFHSLKMSSRGRFCLRGVHTVVHEAILSRTFVRVRPSQPRTRTKVRVRGPPTMLDFLYVVHVYDVQMYELAAFR